MEGIKDAIYHGRKQIEAVKGDVKRLLDAANDVRPENREIGANVMLAYRHLEDARMRLGKAVQALDGGTSCYPR